MRIIYECPECGVQSEERFRGGFGAFVEKVTCPECEEAEEKARFVADNVCYECGADLVITGTNMKQVMLRCPDCKATYSRDPLTKSELIEAFATMVGIDVVKIPVITPEPIMYSGVPVIHK